MGNDVGSKHQPSLEDLQTINWIRFVSGHILLYIYIYAYIYVYIYGNLTKTYGDKNLMGVYWEHFGDIPYWDIITIWLLSNKSWSHEHSDKANYYMRIWGYKNKTIFHGFDQPSLADLPTIYLGYNWMGSRLTTVGIY